jgi:hypothetical protein
LIARQVGVESNAIVRDAQNYLSTCPDKLHPNPFRTAVFRHIVQTLLSNPEEIKEISASSVIGTCRD